MRGFLNFCAIGLNGWDWIAHSCKIRFFPANDKKFLQMIKKIINIERLSNGIKIVSVMELFIRLAQYHKLHGLESFVIPITLRLNIRFRNNQSGDENSRVLKGQSCIYTI